MRICASKYPFIVGAIALTVFLMPALAQDHPEKPASADHAQATPQDSHPAAGSHGAADAGHGADAHAEPSLFAGDLGNVIFTLIIFLGVVVILGKFAWKPILKVLQDREKFIRESIEGARRERLEAEKLLAKYQEQIERARVDATAIVEEGRRDAEEVRRRIQEETRKESTETIDRARREVDLAAKDAIKRLHDETANLAVEIASRIIEKSLNADDHRNLVTQSLERAASAADARAHNN